MKLSGKRSAGNSHAAFDEAGDGNGDKETTGVNHKLCVSSIFYFPINHI
jgi:hypothetical protein